MKKNRKTAVAAVLCAAMVLMTGFSTVGAVDISSAEAESTEIVIDSPLGEQTEAQTSASLAPGQEPAINLIDAEKEGDIYAGDYQLLQVDETNQGKLFVNGGSKIVISAQNDRKNMQSLDVWADNACAMIRLKNITSACDTVFGEPQKAEICGYEAVMYDYDILQYRFLEDGVTREHIDTFKGRNYYFYSDNNAYVLMFDTNDETWNEQVKCFEDFIDTLVVEGKANNALSFNTIVIICAAAAIVIVGVVTVLVVKKNKKKAE